MDRSSNKILIFARTLPEYRMDRKKLHLAEDIVFITLAAVLCGAETWVDIAKYGRSKESFLKSILVLENGIPSDDTFNRFFAGLKYEVFAECFMTWIKSLSKENAGVIAIDGKTIRGAKRNGQKSAIHMVSAFGAANNLVLAQVKTEEKSNEITAIPELLKVLDLDGCIVTIDAMGCQTKIAQDIVTQGADYILAVKENQKDLHSDIVATFRLPNLNQTTIHEDLDIGHGRVETRKCTVISDLSEIEKSSNWSNLKTLVRIESSRYIKATKLTQTETRYYISSLNPNAELIGKAIRSHWSIENNLHWQLDVSFNEDKSRKRDGNTAENYSVILRMALNLIKSDSKTKGSVKSKRLEAGWNNDYLLTLLNF